MSDTEKKSNMCDTEKTDFYFIRQYMTLWHAVTQKNLCQGGIPHVLMLKAWPCQMEGNLKTPNIKFMSENAVLV